MAPPRGGNCRKKAGKYSSSLKSFMQKCKILDWKWQFWGNSGPNVKFRAPLISDGEMWNGLSEICKLPALPTVLSRDAAVTNYGQQIWVALETQCKIEYFLLQRKKYHCNRWNQCIMPTTYGWNTDVAAIISIVVHYRHKIYIIIPNFMQYYKILLPKKNRTTENTWIILMTYDLPTNRTM